MTGECEVIKSGLVEYFEDLTWASSSCSVGEGWRPFHKVSQKDDNAPFQQHYTLRIENHCKYSGNIHLGFFAVYFPSGNLMLPSPKFSIMPAHKSMHHLLRRNKTHCDDLYKCKGFCLIVCWTSLYWGEKLSQTFL